MQIGPRIRIGGTVGKIGQKIKNQLPSSPSMILSNMIPGGSLIGSALNHSVKQDLTKGAENTPFALAATKLLGNGPDTSGGVPGTGGDGGSGVPGDGGSSSGPGGIPGWVVDGLKTGLPAAIQWLSDNKSTLLQGAGIADAAYREMQADKYATQAFKMAQDAYNAKAPLRDAGIKGMLAPTGNPFSLNQHTSGYVPPAPTGTSSAPIPLGSFAPNGRLPNGNPTPIPFGRLSGMANQAGGIPDAGRLTPMIPTVSGGV